MVRLTIEDDDGSSIESEDTVIRFEDETYGVSKEFTNLKEALAWMRDYQRSKKKPPKETTT